MSSRFAKAAAARGRGGNTDEPEMEREPVHKAHGGACYACGGAVDGDGKAYGGEIDNPRPLEEESQEPDDDGSDDAAQRIDEDEREQRARRFARAAKERR